MEEKVMTIDESQIAHGKIVRTCILCGEGTNSMHDHLCERCKKTLLKIREIIEESGILNEY